MHVTLIHNLKKTFLNVQLADLQIYKKFPPLLRLLELLCLDCLAKMQHLNLSAITADINGNPTINSITFII